MAGDVRARARAPVIYPWDPPAIYAGSSSPRIQLTGPWCRSSNVQCYMTAVRIDIMAYRHDIPGFNRSPECSAALRNTEGAVPAYSQALYLRFLLRTADNRIVYDLLVYSAVIALCLYLFV